MVPNTNTRAGCYLINYLVCMYMCPGRLSHWSLTPAVRSRASEASLAIGHPTRSDAVNTGATVHFPPPCRSRLGATSGSTSSAAPVRSAASSAAFRRSSADACRHSCRPRTLHKCASWGSKSTSRATRRSGGCPARRFATLPTRPPALVPKMPRQRRAASCRSFSGATGSARLSPRWRCRASGGK